jgi:hypothetical protein
MLLKHFQHMQHVQYLPIYFCNIHKKQLEHTPETYICNIGEGKPGPVDSSCRGRSQRRMSTTATSTTSTRLGSDGDGGGWG